MKILIISHSSIVRAYQDKIRELSKYNGHEITLLIPKVYFEGSRLVRGHRSGNAYQIVKKHAFFAKAGRQNLHFYPTLYSTLLKIRPQIIHLEEEPESIVTMETILLSKLLLRPPPKIVLFSWRNIDKTHEEWSLIRPQRYIYPLIESYTLKNIDYLIAGNHEGATIYRKKNCNYKIAVIPQYGVNDQEYQKIDYNGVLKKDLGLTGSIIGYVGRLWIPKGIETLLRAVSSLEIPFTLLLLGSGPDKTHFVKLAQRLKIQNYVKFIDAVDASEVVRYLNSLDVMVLPSETTSFWKEQFGRVLIEAMACEVPVIGSSSGEIPNVVGDAGLIFQEANERDLAEKIKTVMESEGLRRKLGKAGRERVQEYFTNKTIAKKILNIYTAL